ncbi:hypothetical protein BC938DRAFT_481838 [Jimgerdemannia flammicorona]|uniref:DOMON domain-containing protein n=1 Tax=Jimgerdemannia flammicorona TaxID=994334 RepID=A0A433QFD5_9FUNG|nr:hypothetical protein BC938DRAFT_481838 [Jimgerdemannia flammicorona]
MHDLYRLFWKLNLDAEVPSIDIALDVKTGGWLGFGLAEPNSGGMRGSDIVTLTVHPHNASPVSPTATPCTTQPIHAPRRMAVSTGGRPTRGRRVFQAHRYKR